MGVSSRRCVDRVQIEVAGDSRDDHLVVLLVGHPVRVSSAASSANSPDLAVSPFAKVPSSALPWITADDMREVDRVMVEDLEIDLVRMMEGAGRCLAQVVERVHRPGTAVVLAGSGGNGGGGLVAARHLANHGVDVSIVLSRPPDGLTAVPRQQLAILERMGVRVVDALPVGTDLIVDALVGYSLLGAPRGRTAELIDAAADTGRPVVSLDVPSGLDATSGATPGDVVPASTTVTLAAPKTGLGERERHRCVGRLFLADISVPPSVYAPMDPVRRPVFDEGPVIEVIGNGESSDFSEEARDV